MVNEPLSGFPKDPICSRDLVSIDSIESDCGDELNWIGKRRPQLSSGSCDLQYLLTLIIKVWHLFDETFAHKCTDHGTECRSFNLEHARQIALVHRPFIGEQKQDVPLGASEIVRTQDRFHLSAARKKVLLS